MAAQQAAQNDIMNTRQDQNMMRVKGWLECEEDVIIKPRTDDDDG